MVRRLDASVTARRRVAAVGLCALALSARAAPARAQNVKEVCATAYDESQALRDQGKLLLARAQFAVCENACPAVLARDCTRWKADVDARLPTIAPAARDAAGHPITDVQLRVDGKPPIALDAARQQPLEAGPHQFRFERPDGSSAVVEITLDERARAVPVVGVFGGAPGSSATSGDGANAATSSGPPALVWVLGGAGVAALGVAGVLAIKGHVDRGDLYDCKPGCAQEDVDAVATTWTVSAVAAGVGAAAVGIAVWLWVSNDGPKTRAARPPLVWRF